MANATYKTVKMLGQVLTLRTESPGYATWAAEIDGVELVSQRGPGWYRVKVSFRDHKGALEVFATGHGNTFPAAGERLRNALRARGIEFKPNGTPVSFKTS